MSDVIEKPEAAPAVAENPLPAALDAMRRQWAGAPPYELAELAVQAHGLAEKEVERLRALLDERWDDAATLRLHSLTANGDGGFHGMFSASVMPMIAAELAMLLKHPEAGNYVGVSMTHPELGDMDMILQRRGGKSPAQVAAEWKARAEAATAALKGDQAEHDRRVTELLEANNAEVQRRRDAVAALRLMLPEMEAALASLIECHCLKREDDAGNLVPDRGTLAPDVVEEVNRLEAAVTAAKVALGMVPGVKVGAG